MRITHSSLILSSLFLLVETAFALEAKIDSPKVLVQIPDLPQFELGPHPNAPKQPTARLFGSSDDGITFSILTPTTDTSTTPAQCASWLAGTVLSRYAPDLSTLQIVRAGDNAYVLIFPFVVPPLEQLKAFIVSGNGKGHCIEVHTSRTAASEADRKQWLNGFRNVRVQTE